MLNKLGHNFTPDDKIIKEIESEGQQLLEDGIEELKQKYPAIYNLKDWKEL